MQWPDITGGTPTDVDIMDGVDDYPVEDKKLFSGGPAKPEPVEEEAKEVEAKTVDEPKEEKPASKPKPKPKSKPKSKPKPKKEEPAQKVEAEPVKEEAPAAPAQDDDQIAGVPASTAKAYLVSIGWLKDGAEIDSMTDHHKAILSEKQDAFQRAVAKWEGQG